MTVYVVSFTVPQPTTYVPQFVHGGDEDQVKPRKRVLPIGEARELTVETKSQFVAELLAATFAEKGRDGKPLFENVKVTPKVEVPDELFS
jgi:hypothetical protein